ncbi:MAG: hypothetical protein WC819_05365 [Parcubacteria group bacterium]|jgi:2-phosphoglycerate kinase
MIYLISGSPRAGKSTLSRELGDKLKIPYLSVDNIRPIIMPYFKADEREKKFPFMKMFNADKIDDFFRNYTDQEIFDADMTEITSVWPGVESLIDHLLLCKMDYIIEGTHLLPHLVKKYKDNTNIKIMYLVKIHKEEILKGLYQNTSQYHDWLMGNTKNEETIKFAAKSLIVYGKYFSEEAKKHGLMCINTEDNFEDRLTQAKDILTSKNL